MGNSLTIQIGKNGVTPGVFELLRNGFKERENIRVCVLKAGTRDKEEVILMAKKLVGGLGANYSYRTVGYTIFLKKWRKIPKKKSL